MSQNTEQQNPQEVGVTEDQYKSLIRNRLHQIFGEGEHGVIELINELFDNFKKTAEQQHGAQIKIMGNEIERLQKLCKDNKINFDPPPPKKVNKAKLVKTKKTTLKNNKR